MLLACAYRRSIGAGGSVWPNGFAKLMTAMAPPTALGLVVSIAPLVLFVARQHDQLRSTGNGGLVESADGWDIRYQSPTLGRLAHDLDRYDPVTGLAASYVRFGSVSASVVLRLDLYFGKSGLAGPESDPVACWAGVLHSIRLSDGIDRSGNGGDLAMDNVIGATLASGAAGDFAPA